MLLVILVRKTAFEQIQFTTKIDDTKIITKKASIFFLFPDSDLSSGKTSQFTRHTTTIEINTSPKDFYDSSNSEDRVVVSKRDSPNNNKDILDGMQHQLKQMEQELAIVGEESKELQQRLSIRQEELEKKVRKDLLRC